MHPHHTYAILESVTHRAPRLTLFPCNWLKAVLWHEEEQKDCQQHRHRTTNDYRNVQTDAGKANTNSATDKTTNQPDLCTAHKSATNALFSDFVGNPCLFRAIGKGSADTEESLTHDNGKKVR